MIAAERGSKIDLFATGGFFDIELDPRRIRRIIANLLGNAIEHGEGKPIEISIDSNEKAVAVAVRDFGVGIAEENLGRVFNRFWRADPSRKRTLGGTGLGLSISAEDTELHRGKLEVWSVVGEGTCFRLTLPRFRGLTISDSPVPLPPQTHFNPLANEADESSSGERS